MKMFTLDLIDIDQLMNKEKLLEWVLKVVTPHLDERLDFILPAVHGTYLYRTDMLYDIKELKLYRTDYPFVMDTHTVKGLLWVATLRADKGVLTATVGNLEEYVQAYLALKERFA